MLTRYFVSFIIYFIFSSNINSYKEHLQRCRYWVFSVRSGCNVYVSANKWNKDIYAYFLLTFLFFPPTASMSYHEIEHFLRFYILCIWQMLLQKTISWYFPWELNSCFTVWAAGMFQETLTSNKIDGFFQKCRFGILQGENKKSRRMKLPRFLTRGLWSRSSAGNGWITPRSLEPALALSARLLINYCKATKTQAHHTNYLIRI